MMEMENKLQKILDATVDQKKVFGTSFFIKKDDFYWQGASGNLSLNQAYFIASTSKLFTTALIMHLRANALIDLDDSISRYLDESILHNLHQYKGHSYSDQISIKHLLSHCSGLPDYFQGKVEGAGSLEEALKKGQDQSWSFEDAIERSKGMEPHFIPGTKNKAHYSDTNFQLLGKIIEQITQQSFAQNCRELIIHPLGLSHTYLYQNPDDKTPQTLYYQNKELNIPLAMTSFGADGGIVSTSSDMLRFIEAFFQGQLFPEEYIQDMQAWNRIFFPMRSGIGLHLFKLPWIMNPFGTVPYFLGHSGLSGALAFYCPKKNLYIAGTVNQVAHPEISFKTMIRLTQVLL
jgi:CubicO group peptidase (beta-lactamase class C family)